MSLIARYLEAQGMPTLIIGSALDIVTHCGVPRFLFVDFPLGNPCGRPWDVPMQQRIMDQALQVLVQATTPGTVVASEEVWGSDAWRSAYMEVNDANREDLARHGEALRQRRAARVKRDL